MAWKKVYWERRALSRGEEAAGKERAWEGVS